MKFQNIITYKTNLQDYVSALFFESEGDTFMLMHKGSDPVTTVKTVVNRYADDPWQYAEKVQDNDNSQTDVV